MMETKNALQTTPQEVTPSYIYAALKEGEKVFLGCYTKDWFDANNAGELVELTAEEYKHFGELLNSGFDIDIANGKVISKRVAAPAPDKPAIELALREVRDERLRQTDWTQLPDSPLKDNKDIREYRQTLREIPQQSGFPHVAMPTPPKILNIWGE